MLKLIIGLKGSGKTKTLIDLANQTVAKSDASVAVITKGTALLHEIKHEARLINVDEYSIDSARSLYGLVAGIVAANYDAKDIFIDGLLKIIQADPENFEKLMLHLQKLSAVNELNIYAVVSKSAEDLPQSLKTLVI